MSLAPFGAMASLPCAKAMAFSPSVRPSRSGSSAAGTSTTSVRVTVRTRLKPPTQTAKARSRATRPPGSLRPPAVNDADVIRSRAISLRDDRFAAVSRVRVVEATGRETDVWERTKERDVVHVDTVAELVVRRDV